MGTLSRDAVLARYRHLRVLNKQRHSDALEFLSTSTILEHGRRLGLIANRTLVTESEDELTLLFDLAIYTAPRGRSRAIDRLARAGRFSPGSDEARIIDAMRRAQFSIFQVVGRHEAAGLVLHDILRQSDTWLVDEGLEQSAEIGMSFASRVLRPEDFAMTCGVIVPVDAMMLEDVFDEVLPRVRGEPETIAEDRRFAAAVYRTALDYGAMERVTLKEPHAA